MTEPPAPLPPQTPAPWWRPGSSASGVEHLEHALTHAEDGAIGCTGCALRVPRPPGMPDYSRASMRDW